MRLLDILLYIQDIANKNGLSKPYIVGGLPRDKLLGKEKEIHDIDITTGDDSIHILSKLTARSLNNITNKYIKFNDGHSSIRIGNLDIDFSSNFILPGITYLLKKSRISNPSDMQKELFSRDFTCNISLMTMDLKKIIDPTGMAINDIENKIIRTCLPPKITIGYSNERIMRALYLSAKLDFDIHSDVISWIKANNTLIENVKPGYIKSKVNKALEYNKDRVIDFLDKTGLWRSIPISSDLSYYLSSERINKNYE